MTRAHTAQQHRHTAVVSLSVSINEVVYLQQLQSELGIGKPCVLLLGDSESSLKLAENPIFRQRSKHNLIKYHSIRDKVEDGMIELCKVDTGLNAADMMTKIVGVDVLKICKGVCRRGFYWLDYVDGCRWMLQGGGMWGIHLYINDGLVSPAKVAVADKKTRFGVVLICLFSAFMT